MRVTSRLSSLTPRLPLLVTLSSVLRSMAVFGQKYKNKKARQSANLSGWGKQIKIHVAFGDLVFCQFSFSRIPSDAIQNTILLNRWSNAYKKIQKA
jgi:hypothetical protein